jgi:hypothetical protein
MWARRGTDRSVLLPRQRCDDDALASSRARSQARSCVQDGQGRHRYRGTEATMCHLWQESRAGYEYGEAGMAQRRWLPCLSGSWSPAISRRRMNWCFWNQPPRRGSLRCASWLRTVGMPGRKGRFGGTGSGRMVVVGAVTFVPDQWSSPFFQCCFRLFLGRL